MEYPVIILALLGVLALVIFVYTDRYRDLKRDYDILFKNYQDTLGMNYDYQKAEVELREKNRELMKQLNEKQNVSRETSYNKSYGMPDVVDWINQQYPPSQEDK